MHDLTLLLAAIAVILLAFQTTPSREKSTVSPHRRHVGDTGLAVIVFTIALISIMAMVFFIR
ncbi:hypothetical protein [Phyllobacterium lublinensis]|jgi:hypothetical protein|uniref:hypothetical protein n=1 Tax=Phyllobacterium lublinensis TaxID=2875708 RepID=UPI001CCF3A6F|nr:hypothetical protein [Phyllobacterium sp. 2063]MBZ9656769.1 hypothetical protein [Phyllobacterium sp. 2063]